MIPHRSPEQAIEDGLDKLKARGFKLTPQRRAMLTLFAQAPEHLTPQAIYERMELFEPGLSRATVYNNIEVFLEVGLLRRVLAESGQTYYDPNTDPHHHACCRRCGKIYDVELPERSSQDFLSALRLDGKPLKGAQAEGLSLWISCLCPEGC